MTFVFVAFKLFNKRMKFKKIITFSWALGIKLVKEYELLVAVVVSLNPACFQVKASSVSMGKHSMQQL